jgi:3-phenylpropionate/cinnamic acid dioxygenase small subunit
MTDGQAAQLQWLVDRAALSDLLHSFAASLDTRDWQAYAANYADDGVVELPDPLRPGEWIVLHKAEMTEKVGASLGRYRATHHISSNHQLRIEGDRASSRSYLQAVHVQGTMQQHWSAGGWYDCEYLRTPAGWKFTRVRLTAVWIDGQPGAISPAD